MGLSLCLTDLRGGDSGSTGCVDSGSTGVTGCVDSGITGVTGSDSDITAVTGCIDSDITAVTVVSLCQVTGVFGLSTCSDLWHVLVHVLQSLFYTQHGLMVASCQCSKLLSLQLQHLTQVLISLCSLPLAGEIRPLLDSFKGKVGHVTSQHFKNIHWLPVQQRIE